MVHRIEEYSVGELARVSGVSVRTLHHYDAIGLLKPAHIAANGYRFYRRAEALRLQEILFYRAAGIPLGEIAALLSDGNPAARLAEHRARLTRDLARRGQMLVTLDRTIAHLKGDRAMTIQDLYKPFSPETQADHEAWLAETYGADMAVRIAASKAHLAKLPGGVPAQMEKLRPIEAALVAAYEAGIESEAADLAAHRAWVTEMWGQYCSSEAYAGLAEMYLSQPDFIARFEALSAGFGQWLPAAMKASAH